MSETRDEKMMLLFGMGVLLWVVLSVLDPSSLRGGGRLQLPRIKTTVTPQQSQLRNGRKNLVVFVCKWLLSVR
jgi:hypothetical protein